MATITVVNENGDIVEKEIVSSKVTIAEEVDGTLEPILEPAVPQRVEYDEEGGMSAITTVCGESENRRESDRGVDMTVEGVITEDQLADAKSVSSGDDIRLISDVHRGQFVVKRTIIEQNTDIISYKPNGGDAQTAFMFQMQFKEPET